MCITGLTRWVSKVTPIPIVKGIQVGAGLSLCFSSASTLLAPLSWTGPFVSDNLLLALGAAILLGATSILPRLPYALVVFVTGLMLAVFVPVPEHTPMSLYVRGPFVFPSFDDFWKAALSASIGQIPLTLLNSVVAASALASDLLPSPPYPPPPSVTSLGLSVSCINFIGCFLGAMPSCHGSGGLAAQYRFGARSGSSVIFLGIVKSFLGVVTLWYYDAVVLLLGRFPRSLLGVLVFAAGLELAKVGEKLNTTATDLRITDDPNEHPDQREYREVNEEERSSRWSVMFMTVGTLLTFKNDAAGFAAGLFWHFCLKVREWIVNPESRPLRLGRQEQNRVSNGETGNETLMQREPNERTPLLPVQEGNSTPLLVVHEGGDS
jgi:hypothetical protein